MRRFIAALCLSVLFHATSAQAHHGGGGAGAFSLNPVISQQLSEPRTNLSFTFDSSWLDENVATVLLYQLQGEYAISPRWSVGGRIPFWSIYSGLLPESNKIGDVAVYFKGQIIRQEKYSLVMGMDTSFPTGNDKISRGAGTVVFTPFLNFSRDFRVLQLYTLLGASFEASDQVNPTFSYELGLIFPILRGKMPVSAMASFRGNTFVDSDTFESGSTKAFAVAGFLWQIHKNWEAGIFGKVSVLDTLDFKPDVSSNNFVTGILNDVKGGLSFTLNYRF